MNLGPTELILILVIVVVLFGGRRIPELMKGFGEGIKSFKEGMRDTTTTAPPSTQAPPAPPVADKK